MAWQTLQSPQNDPPYTLYAENIASGSGSLVALSTDMSQFYLNATTLTNLISGVLFGSSGGYVAYEQAAQLCDWIAAGGSVLLFNAAPGQVNLTGSTLYFTNGASQTVYAVPMH